MRELTFFLGLLVKQTKDGIFISQDKYVAKILRKFGLIEGKSTSTPIDTEKPLLKDPDGEDVDVHTYRSIIGSLMYLTSSRPDIMFAVCACAHFQVTPKASHLHAVKRIFRYLKGKPLLGLWYPKDSPFDLVAYSDSNYAGCKKQTVVATSSTEDEYDNDVTRLQALVDKKKVVITEAAIREVLRLDDAEGVDCLPNEEIFAELACMGYEKPSIKITFYKALFSSQWKFLIYTILHSMSSKCTSWNEFSLAMVSAGICLSTGEHVEKDTAAQGDDTTAQGDDAQEPSIPSPTPSTPPPQEPQDIPSTSQRSDTSKDIVMDDASNQGRIIDDLDKDDAVALIDDREEDKKEEEAKVVEDDKEDEPSKVQEVVDVVTTAKLITEVVTAASETVTAASTIISSTEPQVPAAIMTAALVRVAAASTRRRKGVVIRDPEEESTTIIHAVTKSKDKGKGIMVEEPKPLKKKQQVEMDEEYARKFDYFKGMSYDDICPIFEAKFNSNVDFLIKTKKQMEEESKALQSINETPAQKAAKRRKLNKEVEDLKRHMEILPDEDDDIYTEATPLARKTRWTGSSLKESKDCTWLSKVRLRVEEESEMSLELLRGAQPFTDLKMVRKINYATFKASCFAYGLLNDDKEWTHAIIEIIESVHNDRGKFCFIHKPGGTGKTFLYKNIITRLRLEQMIVLAVASSGIASLLLLAGRIAHSRFVIPLELMENITCGGDFRQILPVIPNAKRPEVIQACINQLELWKYCKVFTLTHSMRVNKYACNGEINNQKQDFNRWVLAVGDGKLPAKKKSKDKPTWIEILEEFLIKSWTSLIEQIVTKTYPDFTSRQSDDEYLTEKAILTPRNDVVDAINENMFKKLGGAHVTYNSTDGICKASTDTADQYDLYPIEFLNSLNFLGMPPMPST
nr:hypothetical protein [Tanacetum cinerariifolium]